MTRLLGGLFFLRSRNRWQDLDVRIDIDEMRRRFPALESSVLWLGPVLLAVGFVAERMWRSFPAPRALETLLIAILALGLGWILARLLRVAIATAIATLFLLTLAYFAGVSAVLAAALLCAAGFVVGCRIMGEESGIPAIVAGIAVVSGGIGWLLPFPIHYRTVYFFLLSIPVVVGRKQIAMAGQKFVTGWGSAVAESPRLAAFAMLVLGIASAGCWLPTVQFDDLAYHLGLPSQLSELHYYRMDVHSQIWAVAPWSGDVVQAIGQVLAGTEARGAVDALWLAIIAGLTWQLAGQMHAPSFARWLTVALVASQPLHASLVGGMQAELPATAAALALALSVIASDGRANLREALRFSLFAALLVGLKTGFVAIVAPLAFCLYWRWRGQWTFRLALVSFAAFLAACASSYVYAQLITGDPFFPLFSEAFHARIAADVLTDTRWTAPVDGTIPWQLTFDTAQYHEGWNGAAGFSLLGLLGALIVAPFSKRSRALGVCALLAFSAAIMTVHYFRYTFPALVLLTVVGAVVVASMVSRRNTIALLAGLIALNLAYQSCAAWTLHVGGVKHRLTHRDTTIEAEHFAPERSLIRLVREQDAQVNVVFCSPDDPFAAELAGRGFSTSHYDPELDRLRIAADADPSGASWRRIFDRTNARYAIVSTRTPHSAALDVALSDAQRGREIGAAQLWKLPERENAVNDFANARDVARQLFWP